jgi:cellulose synthase/poly-beta-1,6-N-acetylglucosamine synthase-like glycosyltransferase
MLTKDDPYWYLHIARATDLSGRDRVMYRALEMFPGILSITTLVLFVLFAFFEPVIAAYLTIAFSIYWLFKTIYLSVYLWHSHRRMRAHMRTDWNEKLRGMPYEKIFHLVIFPFYNEGYEVLRESVRSLQATKWDHARVAIVLAAEERAGAEALAVAERIRAEFRSAFLDVIISVHPKDLPGELAGKGANSSYAAEEARTRILDQHQIAYEDTIVSCFDSDTVSYPHYFGVLTWHFLTAEDPQFSSYQPAPLYNNNIWEAPMLSRVMAYSSSFWQMVQQERPEMLVTFSSHAIPFLALRNAGYWQRNVVSEDSRIFFNLFVRNNGRYRVIPLAYPVSMDANATSSFFGTVKNVYKQHLRWTYGVENIAYLLFACARNNDIPFIRKLRVSLIQIEGFWSLVTHPLILFFIGWLPLVVGGRGFNTTVLSYNLPLVAQGFLTAAMLGLVVSAILSMQLLPPRPDGYTIWRTGQLLLQWVLVPFTIVIFSAVPGLDAQLRLLFGRYMGFWVTPKARPGTRGVS